jgi:hypothetical protein
MGATISIHPFALNSLIRRGPGEAKESVSDQGCYRASNSSQETPGLPPHGEQPATRIRPGCLAAGSGLRRFGRKRPVEHLIDENP